MNSEGRQRDAEAAHLSSRGPGVRRQIANAERDAALGADHVRVGDRIFDLTNPDDVDAWSTCFGLSDACAEGLAALVRGAPFGGRDELAGLAAAFAVAEEGGDLPSRLVLSGHCTGTSIWDGAQKLGELRFADVMALADLMPRAAAQIEDIMLSACSSGFDRDDDVMTVSLRAWREHFPNLKTVWGYGGERDAHSPTAGAALLHLDAWERATRGRANHVDPRSALSHVSGGEPVPYAGSVSTWSIAKDYVRGR